MEPGQQPLTNTDLIKALAEFRHDLRADLEDLSREIRGEIVELRSECIQTEGRLIEKMRQLETNLIGEFHRDSQIQRLRLHTLESKDGNLILRLSVIEERLLALEARRPPSI